MADGHQLNSDAAVEEQEPLPDGLYLTALSPAYRADPYPLLARLQAECPVGRDSLFGSIRLARYAEVRSVLTDRTLWRDPERTAPDSPTYRRTQERIEGMDRGGAKSILVMDDPDHARVRGQLTPVLYKRFNSSRGMVDQVVRRRLDAVEGRSAFDLMEALAVPVPIEVIAHLLGVDEARLEEFRGWSEAIIHTFNPIRTPEQTQAMVDSNNSSMAYLAELMEERRRAPKDDLVSDLVALQDEGAPLSDDDIRVNCLTLLIAGNLTTTDLIGNGVRLLLTHPDQRDALLADPTLASAMVEEVLRFEPPVDSTTRVAPHPMEIAGCPVHARDALNPMLRAANRDPAVFEAPDRFDITKKRAPHVSFGGGAHICLGAPLARIEAQSALLQLFQRFPSLRLADPDAPPAWRALPFFRGLERLEVATA